MHREIELTYVLYLLYITCTYIHAYIPLRNMDVGIPMVNGFFHGCMYSTLCTVEYVYRVGIYIHIKAVKGRVEENRVL